MRTLVVALGCLMFVSAGTHLWGQSRQSKVTDFNGAWWLNTDQDERSGFINGASDCLTWTARESGFNATPEDVSDKITDFYKAHPGEKNLLIIEVWKRIEIHRSHAGGKESAETWKNAHWYLNGDWWGQIGRYGRRGYLEGYSWCVNNRVQPKTDSYSQSLVFYERKIDSYIESHPRAGNEAIADILHRYRDKEATSH